MQEKQQPWSSVPRIRFEMLSLQNPGESQSPESLKIKEQGQRARSVQELGGNELQCGLVNR